MVKILGFYEGCSFNQYEVNPALGFIIIDETGKKRKLSHKDIKRQKITKKTS